VRILAERPKRSGSVRARSVASPAVHVEFAKIEDKGRRACRWEAVRGARTRIPGTYMGVGDDLPHDLAQYVIEASTGFENGFWGLLAKGATFKTTGRKRTKPGRAIIAAHRTELLASEQHAALHLTDWKAGRTTPVTEALDHALAQWRALRPDERITFEWPSARSTVATI
jgi:hypothetical protein